MTPQERDLLTQLTQRINQTQLQEKDPDAENLLGHELGANTDAIYILAQTVLVQDIALQQARAQVTQLQHQLQQAQQQPAPQHSTSFLGRLLGDRDPQPQQATVQKQWQQGQQQPPFQPVPYGPQGAYPPQYGAPQSAQPMYGAPMYGAPMYGSPVYGAPVGQPSFLRGAMQTAAGVAAGALAFEGVESILHGFGHGGMGMAGMGMDGGFERPVEETVVTNYYDQPGAQGVGGHPFGLDDNQCGDNLRGFDNAGSQDGGRDGSSGFAGNGQDAAQSYTGPDEMQVDAGSQGGAYNQISDDGGGQQGDGGGFDSDQNSAKGDGQDLSLDDEQSDGGGGGFDDNAGSDGGGFDDGGGGFDSGGGDSGF